MDTLNLLRKPNLHPLQPFTRLSETGKRAISDFLFFFHLQAVHPFVLVRVSDFAVLYRIKYFFKTCIQ